MDYKYIEQLLDRYWECQTTLEEESILRSFFAQDDVPASLLPYKDIFAAEDEMKEEAHLGEDFDAKMLSMIEQQPTVKAKKARLMVTLKPFYKASAVIAILLTFSMAIQRGFQSTQQPIETPIAVQVGDTTSKPEIVDQATAGLEGQSEDSMISDVEN